MDAWSNMVLRYDGFIYAFERTHTHTQDSQLSEDRQFFSAYYTSQIEWHSRGPCGYREKERESFSILWWAPFSQLLCWKCILAPTTSIITGKWCQTIRYFFLSGRFVTPGYCHRTGKWPWRPFTEKAKQKRQSQTSEGLCAAPEMRSLFGF